MPRACRRRAAIVGVGAALIAGLLDPALGLGLDPRLARAEAALRPAARPFPPRGAGGGAGAAGAGAGRLPEGRAEAAGTWWLGTAGIALVLAVCGGISLATRRGWPQVHAPGMLRVVGRTRLSPRHTVHLLSLGDRILIVGTGPQGAPSLLGELTDPVNLERLLPQWIEGENNPEDVNVNQDESENENGHGHGHDRRDDNDRGNEPPSGAPSLLDRAIARWRRRLSGDKR
jgi:hypothetical protein